MRKIKTSLRVAQALSELVRYDLANRLHGFPAVCRSIHKTKVAARRCAPVALDAVSDAIDWAMALYWKPVQCLQRSVVTVRLLRKCGADAHMVIGYRPAPFFSHAWVEIDGRVVNDSQAYQSRLRVLTRI